MLFAAANYDVSLYDIDDAQLESARKEVRSKLTDLEKQGLLRGSLNALEQFNNIRYTSDFNDCVKDAAYIQVLVVLMT